jgi:hypothetical protein
VNFDFPAIFLCKVLEKTHRTAVVMKEIGLQDGGETERLIMASPGLLAIPASLVAHLKP